VSTVTARKRAGLTPQKVIDTALRLLDETGLDGLTVRRLAAELGVQSPALYWHVRNKQELLAGMANEIILAAGMGPPRDGESWQDWLARRARAYRKSLLAHRDGARIVANAGLSEATTTKFDEELTAMAGLGFTPVLALRTITALTHYINGFVLQEQAERHQHPGGQPPDPLAAVAEMLDRGTSATLLTALRDGGSPLGEQAFDHGLRTLIDGTTVALARQHASHTA
jgi:TetR/AcrR family tetracycline transcriptional repressor